MDERPEPTVAEMLKEIAYLTRRIEMLEETFHASRRSTWRYRFQPKVFDFRQYWPRDLSVPPNYAHPTPNTGTLRFAIVTPSYNQAEFLRQTIESVLGQNYSNLGYIVQDAGSLDGSRDILESYGDRIAWVSAPDGGQADAINKGFEAVSGDIMAYLNSDDILMPGALNYVASAFEKYPDVDFIYGNRIVIDQNGKETGRIVLPPHDPEVIRWADYIPQETMFWRRRVWEKLGQFDTAFKFAMDWDFILRAHAAGLKFKRLPRFLGCFRVYTTQKTFAMQEIGNLEQKRLRERTFMTLPNNIEIHNAISTYAMKQVVYHRLYKLGILKI